MATVRNSIGYRFVTCPICGYKRKLSGSENGTEVRVGDHPKRLLIGKDWPVAELLQMITYKGEEAGLKVERVNPYKTSQTCSRCGVIKENFSFKDRVKNDMPVFVCDSCGFQDNADYNAAKNISRSTLVIK
jgi:putative transposase